MTVQFGYIPAAVVAEHVLAPAANGFWFFGGDIGFSCAACIETSTDL